MPASPIILSGDGIVGGMMGSSGESLARFRFETKVIHWRGPSPFFFAPIPPTPAAELRRMSKAVTYGWGMIPVEARIAGVAFQTSLFPKDQTYLLPLKAAVRRRIDITADDCIHVEMTVKTPARDA